MRILPFFVYGTLKPGESNYVSYLAHRTAYEKPAAISGGTLYTDGQYPFLVIDPQLVQPTDNVHGMLIMVQPQHYHTTLRQIDQLEEYVPERRDNWYERIVYPIQVQGAHASTEAWAYVAGPQTMKAIRKGTLQPYPSNVWHRRNTGF